MAMAAPARAAASKAAPKAVPLNKSTANTIIKQRSATAEHSKRTARSVRASSTKNKQRIAASRQIALDKAEIRRNERQEAATLKLQADQAKASRQSAELQRVKRKTLTGGLVKKAAKDTYDVPPAININTKNSVVNPIVLIIFVWAGIVLLYALITTPYGTAGFLDSMRTWVGLIYQTKPMFTTKATGTTTNPTAPNPFGGGGAGPNGGGGSGGPF